MKDGWLETASEHFDIYYQPNDRAAVESVLEDLEQSLDAVGPLFTKDLPIAAAVVLEPSMAALQEAIGPTASPSLGAYYLGRLELISPLAWQPDLDVDSAVSYYAKNGPVTHELTHLLLDYQVNGNSPVWFTEGMAQYWEWQVKGYIWDDLGNSWRQYAVPVDQLEEQFGSMPENAAYREALSVVQFLYEHYGNNSVQAIVQGLADGGSFDGVLREVLGLDLAQLSKLWISQL
jgi:hypothetical protein